MLYLYKQFHKAFKGREQRGKIENKSLIDIREEAGVVPGVLQDKLLYLSYVLP